ncbi:hypothetical protein HIM_04025 [Hirsutella minnesotensis 3608]|uniref:Uncharacterized protein n=1 Tax=Hirsutella minnesotensis 3608 TaxID=1043627 RepID=A0A0F8A695_9HYPO|nr:hypothetical protein HIM_04025 [Hirsutella minnesotensis 3608]
MVQVIQECASLVFHYCLEDPDRTLAKLCTTVEHLLSRSADLNARLEPGGAAILHRLSLLCRYWAEEWDFDRRRYKLEFWQHILLTRMVLMLRTRGARADMVCGGKTAVQELQDVLALSAPHMRRLFERSIWALENNVGEMSCPLCYAHHQPVAEAA